jgi:hypothetical protein
VLLVSDGNVFLERGLNLNTDVVLEEVRPGDFATVGHHGAGYAMVVFDGAVPAGSLAPGNYLTFGVTGGQTALTAAGGMLKDPTYLDENRMHPLMRFTDLNGLLLRQAPQTRCAPWADSIADATSGPMIAAGEHNGVRIVSVAFDLSDSNWPLRVSFPIFLTNAVDWLTTPPSRPGDLMSRNLLNAQESTLTAKVQPELERSGQTVFAHVPLSRHRKVDLWPYAAAVALLFLIGEWYVFHRRV